MVFAEQLQIETVWSLGRKVLMRVMLIRHREGTGSRREGSVALMGKTSGELLGH